MKKHKHKAKRVAGFFDSGEKQKPSASERKKGDSGASTERAFKPMDEEVKAHNARHGGDASFFADEAEHATKEEPQAIEPDEIIEPEPIERSPDARRIYGDAIDADDRSR
ncbi:MAG TPA: hypothetical protein VGO62_22580 [Myxococcota bacterium]|jgi:hypothetical protein